jgi:DNA-directed RNA polymerase subunit RPC12/RpoP
MAIKIRCTECSKKISIDEAFAGGACRCPYCKAIVMVPGDGRETAARPAEPRPDSPGAAGAQAVAATVVSPESVPMADRVRIQSYVAVVVIGLLLVAMIAGVVAFFVNRGGGDGGEGVKNAEPPPAMVEGANPFETSVTGPSIANDVRVATPVIYVIDCGSTMGGMVDMAAKMTRVSIRSLSANQQFTVIMAMKASAGEDDGSESKPAASKPSGKFPQGVMMLNEGLVSGGTAGEREARKFIEGLQDRAGSEVDVVPAIKVALDMNPKTVVLFTRKDLDDAQPIIDAARKAGVKVVTLAMNAPPGVQENLLKVSKATDSESRAYGSAKLDIWSNEFKDFGDKDK